jgi:predicted nucleic acid-binding Zn ribbon protein
VAPSPASHRAEGIRNVHSGGCDAGGGVEKEEKRKKKKKLLFFFFFSILINQINVNENF